MDAWAKRYHQNDDNVQFICICVESLPVAQMFTKLFGFTKCYNAYIPARQYFPQGFGQLGCSGFVVIQNNRFLSKKTRSYLDYGDYAFVEVDALIAQHAIVSSCSVTAVTRNSTTGPSAKDETPATRQQEDADNQKKKKTTVSTIEAPPLTGIVEMDEEHRDCTVALNHLLQYSTSIPALQAAVDVLAEHFGHEEDLLRAKYGSRNNDDDDVDMSFSPYRSHQKDHERILAIGRAELQRLALSS
jgi:hypothetical protein